MPPTAAADERDSFCNRGTAGRHGTRMCLINFVATPTNVQRTKKEYDKKRGREAEKKKEVRKQSKADETIWRRRGTRVLREF